MMCWILLIPQILRSFLSEIDSVDWARPCCSHARWTISKGTLYEELAEGSRRVGRPFLRFKDTLKDILKRGAVLPSRRNIVADRRGAAEVNNRGLQQDKRWQTKGQHRKEGEAPWTEKCEEMSCSERTILTISAVTHPVTLFYTRVGFKALLFWELFPP